MNNPEYKSIEIDFDVHQIIELEKRGFFESENDVLRRLLKIDEKPPEPNPPAVGLYHAWSGKGVTLPHGTELKMPYRGQDHLGVIDCGDWIVKGERCNSPSRAAGIVAGGTSLNGWQYWFVKRPEIDKHWILLSTLRNTT